MTETHKPSPDSEEPSSPTIAAVNNKYQLKDFHAYGSTVGVIHNPEVVLRAYNNGQRTATKAVNVAILDSDPATILACKTAISHATTNGDCLKDVTLINDNACNAQDIAGGTSNGGAMVYENYSKAMIGPRCYDENYDLSRLSYFWNLPFFDRNGNVLSTYDNSLNPTVSHVSMTAASTMALSLIRFMQSYKFRDVLFFGPVALSDHFLSRHAVVAQYMKSFDNTINITTISVTDEDASGRGVVDLELITPTQLIVIDSSFAKFPSIVANLNLPDLFSYGYLVVILCAEVPTICGKPSQSAFEDSKALLLGPYIENYSDISSKIKSYSGDSFNNATCIDYMTTYLSCYSLCIGSKEVTDWNGKSFTNALKGKIMKTNLGSFTFDQMPEIMTSQVFQYFTKGQDTMVTVAVSVPQASSCLNNKCFDMVINISNVTNNFWPSKGQFPTHCGLSGSCAYYWPYILGACIFATLLVLVIAGWFYSRHRRLRAYRNNWRIMSANMKIIENTASKSRSKATEGVASKRRVIKDYAIIEAAKAEYIEIDQHRFISWAKPELKYLFEMKKLSNNNLTSFLGINFNENQKLKDLLEDTDFTMDEIFKAAFLRDIIRGLEFLQKSFIGIHGLLTLDNCMIDNHWVLKLSKFGITNIFHNLVTDKVLEIRETIPIKTYTFIAPENLNNVEVFRGFPMGTMPGDVYSFGIILYHLYYKLSPYHNADLSNKPLYEAIQKGQRRPELDKHDNSKLAKLIEACIHPTPHLRPTIKEISKIVTDVYNAHQGTLAEQMISVNEKYVLNLERTVADRTETLREMKDRVDAILGGMLPPSILATLKEKGKVIPRMFESATVCFVQLCNFADFMEHSTPSQVTAFLNDSFNMFDEVIDQRDAYKVETIGETYMIVSGVPIENGDKHVFEIAEIALMLRDNSLKFVLSKSPEWKLEIRIGFHMGTIAAGIIGLKAPRYCLFGDTVNFASRMQSNCPPNQIQLSEVTANMLMKNEDYKLTKRGIVQVKGKGDVNTYWLNEHLHHDIKDNDFKYPEVTKQDQEVALLDFLSGPRPTTMHNLNEILKANPRIGTSRARKALLQHN
uniref:Guanylate cyclase n=1 Tax=Rhabditophanes sp. KR3021 TaxID=114890 RepID=A0AC35TG48_9BILA